MAFGLGQDINHATECAATALYPDIRLMTYEPGASNPTPWNQAAPETACSATAFSPFSAVCW